MAKNITNGEEDLKGILSNLEQRLSRIETYLDLNPEKVKTEAVSETTETSSEDIEFRIGEYWFSKVGIIVLSVGVAFLLTLPYQNFPAILPSLIGYVCSAVLFIISIFVSKNFEYLKRYLSASSLAILFFATLRLRFFSDTPVITNPGIELLLLAGVVAVGFFIALKRNSIPLAGLTFLLGYISALTTPVALQLFILLLMLVIVSVILKVQYEWNGLFTASIVLTYLVHFFWFINNPFLGNSLTLQTEPSINLFFLLGYLVVFIIGNLLRTDRQSERTSLIVTTFLNVFLGYVLLLIIVFTKFKDSIIIFNYISSIVFLASAVLFWIREQSKFSTFFYAMFGYGALSIAIISQFQEPNTLIWLCWQSIIVLSTAIWFRSKFIVISNFIIYVLIFLAYFIRIDTFDFLSFSFGIAALASARILNWQKDRLELKTEYMRNTYLTTAFFIFPYTLYRMVPEGYLMVSWILVALAFYILGRLLNNQKYRIMALGTLIISIIYLFVVGTTQLDPVYRIISFMVLGVVLLFTSLIYSRLRKKKENKV